MPAALPAIAAIVSIVGTGTGLGLELANQPGGPPKTTTTPQPLTPTQQSGIKGAVANAVPDIQTQLGGSVSPDYYLQNSELLSGVGNAPGVSGTVQSVINQAFGGGGTPSATGITTGANPGPSTANVFQPAGITSSPGSDFVTTGVSDLWNKVFGGQQ